MLFFNRKHVPCMCAAITSPQTKIQYPVPPYQKKKKKGKKIMFLNIYIPIKKKGEKKIMFL